MDQKVTGPVRNSTPDPFFWVLGQTHMNGWSHIIVSQIESLTDYISLFRLRVLH